MEDNGVKPGLMSFNVLIDACARVRERRPIEQSPHRMIVVPVVVRGGARDTSGCGMRAIDMNPLLSWYPYYLSLTRSAALLFRRGRYK